MNYYLHIPFCRQKCPYCKFALTPIFTELKKRRYIEYLRKEIREYFLKQNPPASSVGIPPSQGGIGTIYFWWGTPSILTLDEVGSILECFPRAHSSIPSFKDSNIPTFQHPSPEITFECNPEDITSEYVVWLLEHWINRISLWVQSLGNQTLKAIHRSDRESIFFALENIDTALLSFSERESLSEKHRSLAIAKDDKIVSWISLNIDFILGLPYSKPWETLANIRELHELFPNITHTSVYMLEAGHYPKEWKKYSINENEMQEEYKSICTYFESIGWHHYEISNWSKPGYESMHNQGYWNHTNTRAFGLSGTSYLDGRRWTNASSFSGYYAEKIEDDEVLSDEANRLEKIIYGIRTFSLSTRGLSPNILRELEEKGDIQIIDQKIILTPAWIFRENTIIGMLIEI